MPSAVVPIVDWPRDQPVPDLFRVDPPPGGLCVWAEGFLSRSDRQLLPPSSRSADLCSALTLLYGRFGAALGKRLSGSLAWIVWDQESRRVVACRDRMGQYNVYYSEAGGRLRLCGRPEPLLAGLAAEGRLVIDDRQVARHLWGWPPQEGRTCFASIHQIPPGHWLVAGRDGIRLERYWSPEPRPVLRLPSPEAYAGELRDLLLEVLRDHDLDSPVAITLSGGMDSASVAVAVREVLPDVERIAVRWHSPGLPAADEGEESFRVARELGMSDLPLRADRLWPLGTEEEPYTFSFSPLSNLFHRLWEATYVHVGRRDGGAPRQVLTGVSGDHLFGGEVFPYADQLLTGRWRPLARDVRDHHRESALGWLPLLRRTLIAPLVRAYLPHRWLGHDSPANWMGTLCRDFIPPEPPLRRLLPARLMRWRMLRDPRLAPILELSNRQASRHGIDLRHPLMDHRLVELAARLPVRETLRGGVRKAILRRAMERDLPASVIGRPRKVLAADWAHLGLRERGRDRVWELLTDMRAARGGFIDQEALREVYRQYLDGRHEEAYFWFGLSLEAWLRTHFDDDLRWLPPEDGPTAATPVVGAGAVS